MKTINLEEIIEKYRLDTDHFADQDFNVLAIEKICLEFGEKLLALAVENAKIEYVDYGNFQPGSCYESDETPIVNKQSILNTINQIE